MTYQATCKFCRKPLTVESDQNCPDEWAARLVALLACNSCADYRSRMTRYLDAIRKTCLDYIQAHNAKELKAEDEDKVRSTLRRLTQGVAAAACRHRGIVTIWEPDFVQQLIDMPDKSNKVVAAYLRLLPTKPNAGATSAPG